MAFLEREFDHVLFDLDDTLYDVPLIPKLVRSNITAYLRDELGVPAGEVEALTLKLYLEHGTTMAGLVATGHTIDFDHFHSKVHATLDYDGLLHPNGVRNMLSGITPHKHIFTNADAKHAAECLTRLRVDDCFETIWCFENLQQLHQEQRPAGAPTSVLCKPNPAAFAAVVQQLGAEARRVVFIDDSPRNCAAAHAMGIFTVLVGREGHVAGADVVIQDIHELPRVLPSIFAAEPPRVEAAAEVGVPIRVPA